MEIYEQNFPALVKEVRRQLGISQEGLAQELGVSFATINRWENGKTTPFKLAKKHFDNFCSKMAKQGKLDLSGGQGQPGPEDAVRPGR